MGPLRRRLTNRSNWISPGAFYLTAAAILLPGRARADACATIRPDWDGTPVTALQEALFLFATPVSLVLIFASLVVLRFRHQWGALAVVVGWTGALTLLTMLDPTGQRPLAAAEGCVGSATLFILAVAAICGAMILYTAPRSTGADTPD